MKGTWVPYLHLVKVPVCGFFFSSAKCEYCEFGEITYNEVWVRLSNLFRWRIFPPFCGNKMTFSLLIVEVFRLLVYCLWVYYNAVTFLLVSVKCYSSCTYSFRTAQIMINTVLNSSFVRLNGCEKLLFLSTLEFHFL